jgi:fibronectin type 3 domain-containing protein
MSMPMHRRILKLCLAAAGLLLVEQAGAQVMLREVSDLHALTVVSPRLAQDPATADAAAARHELVAGADAALDAFVAGFGGHWVAQVDRRTGHVAYVEGSGIPWFPGHGNSLRRQDVSGFLAGRTAPDLAAYDRMARAFAPRVAALLGIDPSALALDLGRSGAPAPHLWFVDYDVLVGGLEVEGARVLFTVNNGNLISVGTENLPAPDATVSEPRLALGQALAVVAEHIGGFTLDEDWVDTGSHRLLPDTREDVRFDAGYETGHGRGVMGVWQFVFRRPDEVGTFRARVDAASGELLEFRDVNEYGSVTGGAYKGDRPAAEVVVPMPFANYGSGLYANSAGIFSGTSGTTTLVGQYIGISDNCGAISKAADGSGVIALGSSSGTDCTTPGSGGAGNTHAARTQFYALNRAKEVARGWLPSNSWINARLTANVNINNTCNAFWNGSTVNFYRSGGGCANTGELPGVSLHEYGHGLDTNDGSGSSADNGTGETYGDTTAFLATHNSCVGNGFLSSNCGGYGNACTSCTGVRDVDYARHTANTPSTVDNFTRPRCPTSGTGYVGPCNREGHCESYVSSETLWDLAMRDLPGAGTGRAWTVLDRLWYLSRSSATKGFQCTTSSTPWTANGCFTGSYFRTMRAVDDDNGNLTDGTPHGGALAAAFNRHGIACTSDAGWNTTFAGVTPPAAPALSVTAGSNSASLSWSGSSGVYDVYRNETGCNAGFTKVTNDTSSTGFTDSAVANGVTYYYQVVAQPSGNEAAASAPSTCQSVTPTGGTCTPPAAPTGVTASATSQTAINVSWSASSGATSYAISRSTTSGGPYTQVGTSATTSFADSGLSCNTTYYYVVSASNGSCSSGNSAQASALTQACTGNVLTNGVPVSNISGATGSQQFWTMAVPAGSSNLSFQISGGTGDADMYVRFGSPPTTTTYDCRPYLNGNNETCSFATPQTGTYHVMLRGYTAYSGVTLVGSYSGACTPPAAPTGVGASATSQTAINVSWGAVSGATSYKILRSTTSGGPYSQVGTSTTTSFANTGLTCSTTYHYVVRSSNGTCDSPNSAQASAATQTCTGGTELLTNGGFESGTTPWVMSGNAYRSTGSYPHTGVAYSYLGNVNNANGNEYQQVTIPSGTSPNLTFWLNVTSSETTTTTQYDRLFIEVTNTSGTVLGTLATFSNLNKGTAGVYSQKGPYSLSAWAGQTVRIRFRGTTDSSLITVFRVDDVSAR